MEVSWELGLQKGIQQCFIYVFPGDGAVLAVPLMIGQRLKTTWR